MARGLGRDLLSMFLNLYSQGLLGGLPAQERQAKVKGLEHLGEISRKPTWSKLTPGMEFDPTAEGLLPGQRRMEAEGRFYRIPSEMRREEMVGKTYGELGALGDIVKNVPIAQTIAAKGSRKMLEPWLKLVLSPEQVDEMLGGTMFPTEAFRKAEELRGLIIGVPTEQRKGVENILGGLASDVYKILYGVKEKEKQEVEPRPFTLSPGQKRFPGEGGEPIAEVDPIEKTKTQASKDLLMNYKRAIDQTLKKYGIDSGLSFETRPDGTMAINMGGKESIYQALQKKASAGHIRAAADLDKINYWYEQIDKVIGVPKEIMERSDEERELDLIDPFRVK